MSIKDLKIPIWFYFSSLLFRLSLLTVDAYLPVRSLLGYNKSSSCMRQDYSIYYLLLSFRILLYLNTNPKVRYFDEVLHSRSYKMFFLLKPTLTLEIKTHKTNPNMNKPKTLLFTLDLFYWKCNLFDNLTNKSTTTSMAIQKLVLERGGYQYKPIEYWTIETQSIEMWGPKTLMKLYIMGHR